MGPFPMIALLDPRYIGPFSIISLSDPRSVGPFSIIGLSDLRSIGIPPFVVLNVPIFNIIRHLSIFLMFEGWQIWNICVVRV